MSLEHLQLSRNPSQSLTLSPLLRWTCGRGGGVHTGFGWPLGSVWRATRIIPNEQGKTQRVLRTFAQKPRPEPYLDCLVCAIVRWTYGQGGGVRTGFGEPLGSATSTSSATATLRSAYRYLYTYIFMYIYIYMYICIHLYVTLNPERGTLIDKRAPPVGNGLRCCQRARERGDLESHADQ